MANSTNNIAELLRAAKQSGMLDYTMFTATAQELIRGNKRKFGESFIPPLDNRYNSRCALTAEQYYNVEVEERESHVRRRLAAGISMMLERPGLMDIQSIERKDTRDIEFQGSVYIFNEQQMKELIREVEDAVKESLAE
jgi:chromosomal replication initiation ATPase DnaA